MELRDDLYVVIMSATIDTKKLQNYLGCEVLSVPGRQFAVNVVYEPEKSIVSAVREGISYARDSGNVLVFLPGISDIRKAQ
jgi:ATP-dependent helicase HrpB